MSLLNGGGLSQGLSQLGQGVAQFAGQAAIDYQKADLAKQAAVLADQLATTRETALQGQRQQFETGQQERLFGQQATLAGQRETFEGAQKEKEIAARASESALSDQRIAAREATARKETAAYQTEALTPEEKLLTSLGVQLQPRTGAGASATSPSPTGDASSSSSSGAALAPAPVGTGAAPSSNPIVQRLVEQKLGLPMAGSEAAIRAAIADDVNKDPSFKGLTVGQKAAEIENRFAIASSKMGKPEDLHAIAQATSTYDLSPLDQRARMMAGGPDVTADVLKLNPKYSETKYDQIKETQKAIAPGGNLFVPISAMETSLGHAQHFLNVATQLGNYAGGNWANIIPNKLLGNTGQAPLVNALQQTAYAMAEEGNRIYAGNAGTESAINNWYKSFPVNGSLADQAAAVKNFAQLMGDKFDTMDRHVNKTFKDSGLPPAQLLSPEAQETYQRLKTLGPNGKPVSTTPLSDPLGIR